jgi:hypothetical protein
MCAHIAAGLQHISAVLEKEKANRKAKPQNSVRRNTKIQVRHIVECLTERELRQFLLNQSSKNSLLAGELKAKYAYKVIAPYDDDKYYGFIRKYASALSPGKISTQRFKKLVIYLEDLADHSEDLASQKNYRESFLILIGLIKYLIVGSGSYRYLDWTGISKRIHESIDKLFSEELPIEFRQEIFKKFILICREESYQVLDPTFNLYCQLFHMASVDKDIIYLELKHYSVEHPQNENAQIACWNLGVEQRDVEQIQSLIDRHMQNLALLQRFFSIFSAGSKDSMYAEIAHYLLRSGAGPRVRNWAFEQLLLAEGDKKKRIELYTSQIIDEGRPNYFLGLKSEAGASWPEVYHNLIGRVKGAGKQDLLLDLLVLEQDRLSVLDFFRNTEDVDLLLKYARFVWEADKEFLRPRLELGVRDHLRKHIGHQSADYILHVFNVLSANRMDKIKDQLLRMVADEFSERKHLIKYLKEKV